MAIIIDQLSLAAKPLAMYFESTLISIGTGFVWRSGNDPFLITNWHNVTGINPQTGKHISNHAGEPDRLKATLMSVDSFTELLIPLRDANGCPTWVEHPEGRNVDVVALPLARDAVENVDLHPINEMPARPIKVSIGMDAFILGYPFGIGVSALPIWKRASIASEPELPVGNLRHFFVDTASRPGMSGSPVILRCWGGYPDEKGGVTFGQNKATKFIGVYSGRIGADDELQAQLGIVWRAEVVEQIIANPRPGSLS